MYRFLSKLFSFLSGPFYAAGMAVEFVVTCFEAGRADYIDAVYRVDAMASASDE
jgi:hypothetical protein